MFAHVLDSASKPLVEKFQYDPENTVSGLAFETGHPVYVPRPDPVQFPSVVSQQFFNTGLNTLYSVPVTAHGRKLGVLSFASTREDAWSTEEQEFLQEITKQVSIAADNSVNFETALEAEREAKKQRDRSRLLLEVNNAVVSHLNLSELLKSVSGRLAEVMSNDSAFIALCGPEETLQVLGIDLGKLEDVVFKEGFRIPMEGTPEEQAIKSGRPVLVTSVDGFLKFPSPWVRYAVDHGLKSGCINPLTAHGRTLGALGVVSLSEDAFSPEAARLLEEISGQIAIAVENALNFEKSRQAEQSAKQERDRSRLLLEINNALVSHLDLRELVRAISTSLQQLLQHDCVGLAIHDAESGKLFAQVVSSELEPMMEGIYYTPEGTVSGLTFTTGEPVYIWPLDSGRFPSSVTKGFIDRGLKTLYAVPP